RIFARSFNLEAEHAATASHLLHRQRLLRMSFEKWVIHGAHLGVRGEKLGNAQSTFILALHPHRQRLDPAQEHERGMRVHNATERSAGTADGVNQILAPSCDAADK